MTDLRTPSSACAAAHQISAFELFCAYHLGIQEDGTYRFGNVHDVAKRFGVGAAVIRQSLEEFALRPDDLWTLKWDLSEAQVAIAVATRCRLRAIVGALERAADGAQEKGDWARELADDRRVNAAIFGKNKSEEYAGALLEPARASGLSTFASTGERDDSNPLTKLLMSRSLPLAAKRLRSPNTKCPV